jgi:hypothetical protein
MFRHNQTFGCAGDPPKHLKICLINKNQFKNPFLGVFLMHYIIKTKSAPQNSAIRQFSWNRERLNRNYPITGLWGKGKFLQ